MPEFIDAQAEEGQRSGVDVENLAKLCAVGAVPIPNDLPEPQQRQLLMAIAASRRKRLLNLFAAAIADDIWREQQTTRSI